MHKLWTTSATSVIGALIAGFLVKEGGAALNFVVAGIGGVLGAGMVGAWAWHRRIPSAVAITEPAPPSGIRAAGT